MSIINDPVNAVMDNFVLVAAGIGAFLFLRNRNDTNMTVNTRSYEPARYVGRF